MSWRRVVIVMASVLATSVRSAPQEPLRLPDDTEIRDRLRAYVDGAKAAPGVVVGVLEDAARAVLAKASKTEADIDFLIPHQANIRIMQSTAKKLKLGAEKLIVTVDEHGNTSAASIPLALDVAVRDGRVRRGHTLMLEGVGGGFTWGAVLLEF